MNAGEISTIDPINQVNVWAHDVDRSVPALGTVSRVLGLECIHDWLEGIRGRSPRIHNEYKLGAYLIGVVFLMPNRVYK